MSRKSAFKKLLAEEVQKILAEQGSDSSPAPTATTTPRQPGQPQRVSTVQINPEIQRQLRGMTMEPIFFRSDTHGTIQVRKRGNQFMIYQAQFTPFSSQPVDMNQALQYLQNANATDPIEPGDWQKVR